MPKYHATIQYLGTRYRGWQKQPRDPTIQSELASATRQVTGEEVSWTGAGRTDSGVHALGQCAHFVLDRPRDSDELSKALNGVLPWDIRVTRLRKASTGFHAQRGAQRKRYEYRIYTGAQLSPFLYGRVLHIRRPVDVERMSQAAGILQNTWDFRGFAASSTSVKTFERTIFRSEVKRHGYHLRYLVEADGFLHHMVRNIVGTLLEVGTGRRPPEDVLRILASRDRRTAGPTAKPHGLYLVKVWYG